MGEFGGPASTELKRNRPALRFRVIVRGRSITVLPDAEQIVVVLIYDRVIQ
jgi:hypothetical protein